jgi:hypothetical protein
LEVCQCEHDLNSTIQIVVIHSVLRNRHGVERVAVNVLHARHVRALLRALA